MRLSIRLHYDTLPSFVIACTTQAQAIRVVIQAATNLSLFLISTLGSCRCGVSTRRRLHILADGVRAITLVGRSGRVARLPLATAALACVLLSASFLFLHFFNSSQNGLQLAIFARLLRLILGRRSCCGSSCGTCRHIILFGFR